MGLSFLTPARSVLVMADDALYVYKSSAKGVAFVQAVPWETESFQRDVAAILVKDGKKNPVLILNDMVEQHYRKEKILKKGVSIMDKGAVIQRRLNVAFPNYPVRAAYPLKEKLAVSNKSQDADLYIFAAIPDTSQFSKALSAVKSAMVSVAGLCLLPVESSDMVQALSNKLAKTKRTKSKWVIFIGQHKNGGLRQIVTKNGELALTRMSLLSDVNMNSTAWAHEVHQEFQGTMSYLARFGYAQKDGLDVIVVGAPEACDVLEGLIKEPCQYTGFTAPQVAAMLGFGLGAQQSSPYFADSVHVAWAGRKNRFVLPLKSIQLERFSRPRQIAGLASVVLCLGALYLGYGFLSGWNKLSSLAGEVQAVEQTVAQLDVRYQKELQRKKDLGFDVELIQNSIAVHEQIMRQSVDYTVPLMAVGSALGKDLHVDTYDFALGDGKSKVQEILKQVVTAVEGEKPYRAPYTVKIIMSYPGTTDIEKGNREVVDLRDRLQQILKDEKVQVTKLLKDFEYVEEVVLDNTKNQEQKDVQDYTAEIVVQGGNQ